MPLLQRCTWTHYRPSGGWLAVLPALGVVLTALLLSGNAPPSYPVREGPIRTPSPSSPAPLLEDVTLAAGITRGHWQSGERITGLNEVIGPGACVLDYDGDGRMDLFVVGGQGQSRYHGSA